MTVDRALEILRRAYKLKADFDRDVYKRIEQRYPNIAHEVAVAWYGD